MVQLQNLNGEQFGSWKVIGVQPVRYKRELYWLCKCQCGTISEVHGRDLRNGKSTSCGCQRAIKLRQRNFKDGLAKHPLRGLYSMMKDRCSNPNNHAYPRYGGRGIYVCDRWRESFANFLLDMGERPPNTSLHRTDNDGPYSPQNCVWATAKWQCGSQSIDRKPRKHIERGEASA